ncbi:peptidylprolyl isomerase [Rhodococcus sp. IEGM 248]|uniref:peptidylprolyl isomerase n=1 Tax=Rhodococcus TaxID=1827 RepID=UPI0013C17AD4|nr:MULTISPECIES: peptidylprolyl isomerase [Rhodococcus]MDI9953781.1 peptidylprolyl isomerase [Rhodococcus sp. IEGM 1305]MDV7086038.1 peptidylprolyl isomerase [Rhodococcus opacus]NDV05173.1 peptidylprolyl isomerase [Rhodococcus sp. IEGM 248]UOT07167.1 peptidylprolyl isomerase [Rhodococcus opacus]
MPSNEQRREAAKRKLERQLERRADRARKRKQLTIAGSVLGVVLVVAAGAVVFALTSGDDDATEASAAESVSASPQSPGVMPAGRSEPLPEKVSCTYTPGTQPPAKQVNPPRTDDIDTTLQEVSVSMQTTQGNIGLILDNADSPCTVNNFLSLASQNYFDNTPCHRLVTSEGLKVLQCGDPTGAGTGGPGYGFANEFPTDQYEASDPSLQVPVTYPRGTIAMANSGQPDSNGSQFFLVYADSQLPPQYTAFGKVDETGLATIEKVAAAGDDGSMQAGGGKPNLPIDITSVRMD